MAREAGQRAFQNARLRKQQRAEADELFARAIALHQAGSIGEAQALYVQILRAIPDHFDALHFLGVAESQCGHYEVAERLLQHALAVEPHSAAAHANRGIVLHDLGRLDEALASFDQALAIERNLADALCNRGNVLHDLGRFEEALASYDKAIAIKPGYAEAHSNRVNPLRALKHFDEALKSADKAIALNPKLADAHLNRGNALQDLARFDEALASYDKAIALNPQSAKAFNNRGNALKDLKRIDDALASYEKALAINPNSSDILSNRGDVLQLLARYEEAFATYERALAINPDQVGALLGRSDMCIQLNRLTEAFAACSKALAIDPKSVRAWMLLGQVHERHGNLEEAIACNDKALAIQPDFASAISSRIFALDLLPNIGFKEHQEARNVWWRQIGLPAAAKSVVHHDNDRDPARRLVLGYVSSDFRQHSAAFSFRPVLQNHDKTRFEIVCYSSSIKQDDTTKDFQRVADRWRDASQWNNDRLVDQIQADKIDILIDLSGHSAGHRLSVFARKPAPVQVTAWGHATGTGLPTIDYLFSDPVAIPGDVRPLFPEKIYDLPCLITMEPPPFEFHPTDPPIFAKKHVTFGVFNRISKISDEAVRVWARIVLAGPRSRLVIKHGALSDDAVRRSLAERIARHGIPADRVDLVGATSREEHLKAYENIDICLDPFPQNGGISTWEALHRGVPVVAQLGSGVPSRVSGAILSAVGLNEWVAKSEEDYVAIALRYASMPDVIKALRYELPNRILTSAAGNPASYAKAVEDAYRAMWENYCRHAA